MWVRPISAGPPHKCGAPHKRCRPLGGEFLLRFAPLDPGSPRVAFALSRSGRPERLQRNTHSEAFCAMGLDELGKAAGESRYRVRYGAGNRDMGWGTAIGGGELRYGAGKRDMGQGTVVGGGEPRWGAGNRDMGWGTAIWGGEARYGAGNRDRSCDMGQGTAIGGGEPR